MVPAICPMSAFPMTGPTVLPVQPPHSTTRRVYLYSAGRAPRVPLIESPPQIFLLFALTPQLVPLCFKSLLTIEPQLLLLWSKSLLTFEPQFFPPLFQPFLTRDCHSSRVSLFESPVA